MSVVSAILPAMTMQPDQPPKQLPSYQEVTIDEAAVILGKSPSTVRRMVKRGILETVKASTPTGFVYRIRLATKGLANTPNQSLNVQNQRSRALEDVLAAFRGELASLVEANDRHVATIKGQAEEIERLRMEAAYSRRSLWRRLVELVKP